MLNSNRLCIPGLFLSVVAFSSAVLADDLVVYSAKGVHFTAGQVINGSEFLRLKSGQEVNLIAPDGKILKLSGPYSDIPLKSGDVKPNKGVKDAIKNLLSSSGSGSKSFGISRSADDVFKISSQPDALPDPWLIDVTHSGPVCYLQGQETALWRAEKAKDAQVSVRIEGDVWSASTVWSAGKSKLALPPSMPLTDGAVYHFSLDAQSMQTRMNVIPSTVQSATVQAAWLREKGCTAQFQALARSLL